MKIIKRSASLFMALLLLLSIFSSSSVSLAAAKKIKSIRLNKENITVYVGDTYKLTATVSPSDASNKKLNWTTSNQNTVTVSGGKISAKKAGTATITAKATDGSGKKATCKVTVKKRSVKSIKLNKTKASLYEGKTLSLKATVNPTNATDKKIRTIAKNLV